MEQREKHIRALNSFTDQVKKDAGVVALLLLGSLSYGRVWEKSDIDLTMIVRDGSIKMPQEYCVDEDGIEIHVYVMESAKFKTDMQKSRGGLFTHGYLGKGTMVFSKDESLTEFFEDARKLGMDDAILSISSMVENLIVDKNRAEKWVTVFDDPLYSQRFLQRCCTSAADIVLLLNGEIPTRESVLRAMELNPALMHELYVVPSTTSMTKADIRRALQIIDDFLTEHIDTWSRPIIKYLEDGEVKKMSECMKHFGSGNLAYPMAFLASKGLIERVTLPSRVFTHSKLTIEEVAYFYIGGTVDTNT